MKVKLAYGQTGLTVDLPEVTDILEAEFVSAVPNEVAAIQTALRHPIQSAPLSEKVKSGDRVIIVHSDITRATPNDRMLPVLIAELEQAGIASEHITLMNALGTHRPQTNAELRQMLGGAIVDRYRCLQHDAFDDENLVSLGTTASGNPVRINRHLMEADVRIFTGFIEPHFFAGFSGGPKAALPALSGAESVFTNHGRDMIAHPKSTWGVLEGNPIWEEMKEVALKTAPTMLLNVTLNANKEITGVFAGDLIAAHTAGATFVQDNGMVKVSEPYDVVITTNSGYPLDQNLYQTVKGMSAANKVLRDGGTIIMAAACADGLPDHGKYADLLAQGGSPQGVLAMLDQPGFSEHDQWQVQIQAMIQLRADVHVYSDGLTDDQIERALFTPCRNIEQCLDELQQKYGPDMRVCAIPEGPQTIAYLDEAVFTPIA
ncbi:MAG: nickel-dependent lactate racemase [Chloroflexota bacterium]